MDTNKSQIQCVPLELATKPPNRPAAPSFAETNSTTGIPQLSTSVFATEESQMEQKTSTFVRETSRAADTWYVVRMYRRVVGVHYRAVEKLATVPGIYAVLGLRLVSVIVALAVVGVLFCRAEFDSFVYGVFVAYIWVQVLMLASVAKSFYDAFTLGAELQYTHYVFAMMMLMEILICPLLIFTVDEALFNTSLISLGALALFNAFYELCLIAWTLAAIFLTLVAVPEILVRLFTCKLTCPMKQRVAVDVKYSLYPFAELGLSMETKCVICLDQFSREAKVCRLKCDPAHIFHETCIFVSLSTSPLCPLCRSDVDFC